MLHRKWEAYSFGWICGVSSSLGWSLHSREDTGTGVRSGTEASEGRKLTQGLMYRGGLSYHRCVHDWLVKSSFLPKRSLNKTTKLALASEAGEVGAAHHRVAKQMTFRGWLIFPASKSVCNVAQQRPSELLVCWEAQARQRAKLTNEN